MGDLIEANFTGEKAGEETSIPLTAKPAQPEAIIEPFTEETRIRAMLTAELANSIKLDVERIAKGLELLAEYIKQGKTLEDFSLHPLTIYKFIQIYEQMPDEDSHHKSLDTISILTKAVTTSLIILCRTKTATKRDAKTLRELWGNAFPGEKERFGITAVDIMGFEHEATERKALELFAECFVDGTDLPGGETRKIYEVFQELESVWPDPSMFPGTKKHEIKLFMQLMRANPSQEKKFRKVLESFGISFETFRDIMMREMLMEREIHHFILRFAYSGEKNLKGIILNLADANWSKSEIEMVRKFFKGLEDREQKIKTLLTECRANKFDNLPELGNEILSLTIPSNTSEHPYGYFNTSKQEIESFKRRARIAMT